MKVFFHFLTDLFDFTPKTGRYSYYPLPVVSAFQTPQLRQNTLLICKKKTHLLSGFWNGKYLIFCKQNLWKCVGERFLSSIYAVPSSSTVVVVTNTQCGCAVRSVPLRHPPDKKLEIIKTNHRLCSSVTAVVHICV